MCTAQATSSRRTASRQDHEVIIRVDHLLVHCVSMAHQQRASALGVADAIGSNGSQAPTCLPDSRFNLPERFWLSRFGIYLASYQQSRNERRRRRRVLTDLPSAVGASRHAAAANTRPFFVAFQLLIL